MGKRMNRIKYNYNKPIPSKRFPNHNVQYKLTDDPIIVLTDISDYKHYKDRIIYDPVYFNMQLPYATDCCKMRLRTAKLLLKYSTHGVHLNYKKISIMHTEKP